MLQFFEPESIVPEQLNLDLNGILRDTSVDTDSEIPKLQYSTETLESVEAEPIIQLTLNLESDNSSSSYHRLILSRKAEMLKKIMISKAKKELKCSIRKQPKYFELHSVANFRFAQKLGVNAKLIPHQNKQTKQHFIL
ncbi:hypothetical protein NPIL_473691 [Nephila pilipes]|uniref:Uncharacterized protein n=1 Tax=Nephila pilipes TaxID=299642 RepID=A0A8X6T901_NEPPI|nr:hypothetical protein NPIL_473691 [Nephila pilipes]